MLGQKKTKVFLNIVESRKLDDYEVDFVTIVTKKNILTKAKQLI